jgi:DNA-binding NtrC family response regulator
MSNGAILIVDDEERLGTLLARSLARAGYGADYVREQEEALARLREGRYDALVTDLRMPGIDGLEMLRRAKRIDPGIEVVLMTAFATVDTAKEALKLGAADYLTKPFSADGQLKPLLERLLAGEGRAEKEPPTRVEPAAPAANPRFDPSTDRTTPLPSATMQEVYAKLEKIARSNATVLLRGESGTGKEALADLLQRASPRAPRAYVKINCGALPETLLESELFGHVRGAFTGAVGDRDGLFRAADGGTILLDEVGEITPALQVKLLRVLQTGEFIPVGDTRTQRADVRVIAATNRDLEGMVARGTFRQDLYYRLNVVPLTVPPLRDRPEDIETLVAFFLRRFGAPGLRIAEDAREALLRYGWPGNIRELENAIEHATVLGDGRQLLLADLPAAVQEWRRRASPPGPGEPAANETLEDTEKRCLLAALEKTGGNRTRASRLLGITRRTLGYRLRKYGLEDAADRMAGGSQ